ncbi:MAG: HlyD family secretion protein [Gemmataceae bacterium]|nr:HlyD family secretion protein [Gemmataceae bacterium]
MSQNATEPRHPNSPEAPSRNGPTSLSDRVRSLRLAENLTAGSGGGGGKAWLAWMLCAVLAASTLYLGYLVSSVPPPPEPKTGGGPPGAKISSGEPKNTPGGIAYEAKGYLIPAHQIQVSPKVGGMVTKLNVVEGKRVKEGDILCELEDVDYRADFQRAKAALQAVEFRHQELSRALPDETAQAKAALEGAEEEQRQFYLDWKRNINLRGGGAVAAREIEMSEKDYKTAERRVEQLRLAYRLMLGPRKQRVETVRAEVDQARADLTKAKWRLDNCIVRSPITGTILTKKTEEGNIVNPIAFNVSANICEMADLADLEVDLTIQERDIAKLFVGQKCRVKPDAFPDKVYAGTVARLMPIADRAKGTISVRVRVLNIARAEEGIYLRPEGSVFVTFLRADKP